MHKPINVAFPEESILKNCWDNNPDMGGFMYAFNDRVYIKKGFKTWESFMNGLNKARKITGDDVPYVCHFRISTQGYDTSCCQPFPLSENMNRLKKQKAECHIGVAHNGILDITSDGAKDYSDTMKFITDYLINIIRSYDWFNDERTCKLIENLIDGSRFAILDKNGHCAHMGRGWVEDYGCFFSNSTYSYAKKVWTNSLYFDSDDYWDGYGNYGNYGSYGTKKSDDKGAKIITNWYSYWNSRTHTYDFSDLACPYTEEDDDSYCTYCSLLGKCTYTQSCGLCKKA